MLFRLQLKEHIQHDCKLKITKKTLPKTTELSSFSKQNQIENNVTSNLLFMLNNSVSQNINNSIKFLYCWFAFLILTIYFNKSLLRKQKRSLTKNIMLFIFN